MPSDPQNTSGGPAVHSGANYQNRVAAWSAVQILAGQDAVPDWDLPAGVTLESLQAEARSAVDDLAVDTSSKGVVRTQAKHTLTLGTSPSSEFGSAISQVVKEYRQATPALDPLQDRLVIATSTLSSAPIKTHIPAFLKRLRSSSAASVEWTAGNSQENDAAEALKQHIIGAWRQGTNADPPLDDIHALLKLMRIQILDVDDGGFSEREAKLLLRIGILVDPTQADAAWSILISVAANFATKRQRADRNALQRALTDAGIAINAARNDRADIERLKDHTAITLGGLRDYSHFQVGGKDVVIERAVSPVLQAAASRGHRLMLGLPGAGKSGALHKLARDLNTSGADVVLFAVDQLAAESSGALRSELNLTHELLTVLLNWPGIGPGYLIIDALDAARSDGAVKTLQTLIRNVTSIASRWHVIASVRKYDLRYDRDLQRLFRGTPADALFKDAEFPFVNHVNVPALSDDELDQLKTQSPELSALVSDAPAPLRALLHLPFNLRLLADLLDAGVAHEELKPVRTQVELLERYWHARIVRNDGNGDGRELILRRVVTEMVKARALRVSRPVAISDDAASTIHLNELLSSHVLAEWTTQTGSARRDFITFPHHLLFDYAVSRLYVPAEVTPLTELLQREPDLLIAIRPSIEIHFQRLWHEDPPTFWDLTFQILVSPINEVGKLLGPSVAALLATTVDQLQPLIDGVADPARADAGLAALRHILATRLTYGLTAGLINPGPWAEVLDVVAANLTLSLANSIRPYVNFLSENFCSLRPLDQQHVGTLVRRLLRYCLANVPFNATLANNMIMAVAKTMATEPAASIAILRECITERHLAEHGFRTFPALARQASLILPFDAGFVCDLYIAGFTHQETSDEKTAMGDSQILPMSSNRKQDYEMGHYILAQQFPRFLEIAPRQALGALLPIVEVYVTNRRKAERNTAPVEFNGTESSMWRDNSFIWDGGATHIENVPQMLQAFRTYLSGLTDLTLIDELVSEIVATRPPGTVWRLLLEAGTAAASSVGRAIRSLAWDHYILTERDTRGPAGFFLQKIFPLLEADERTKVETAILNIPVKAPENLNAANRARDQLLGCLDRELVVTAAAIARLTELDASGGPPQHSPDPRIHGSAVAFDHEEYLRERGVPVDEPEQQQLLTLSRSVGSFGTEFINSVPPDDRLAAILLDIEALDTALSNGSEIHPTLRNDLVSRLMDACIAVLRGNLVPADALPLLHNIVLRTAADPAPEPEPEDDDRFQESPAWNNGGRTGAAYAAMLLAHRSPELAEAMRPTILNLARDLVPIVRFRIAGTASHLFKTMPELMWTLLGDFAANEGKRGVLQAALDVIQWCARVDPSRVAQIALTIYERLPAEGRGVDAVRKQCCNVFCGLAIWDQEPACIAILEKMVGSPVDFHSDLAHIVFDLGGYLRDENKGVVKSAFDLLDRILDTHLAAVRILDPELDGRTYASLTEPDRKSYDGLLRNIDQIALRLYLISGASSGRQSQLLPADPDFYGFAKPLLAKLTAVGHPHTAHNVVETLAYFATLDPEGVLILVSDVVRSGSVQGYQYEQLGEESIVGLVERYLAEYRPILKEPRCHVALMQILDVFVHVGWPKAHQLTYRLGEIYR